MPQRSLHISLAALVAAVCLSGCAHDPKIGAYQRDLRNQGFVGYYQPVGDPRNVNDWNKYGPGTVLRNGRQQDYYYRAKTLLGDAGVAEAMNPANASPISLFSGRRVSGYDFDGKGGWTLDAVNQISGALNLKSATSIDIQYGKAWKANPKGEGELHEAVRTAAQDFDATSRRELRRGRFAIVQNAVWTDSVRYYFKQEKSGGASSTYKLTGQEVAALQAKGYRVVDGGVEVSEPRFIAFTPLPAVAGDLPANR